MSVFMILLADFVILMLAVLSLMFSSIGCIVYADNLIDIIVTDTVCCWCAVCLMFYWM